GGRPARPVRFVEEGVPLASSDAVAAQASRSLNPADVTALLAGPALLGGTIELLALAHRRYVEVNWTFVPKATLSEGALVYLVVGVVVGWLVVLLWRWRRGAISIAAVSTIGVGLAAIQAVFVLHPRVHPISLALIAVGLAAVAGRAAGKWPAGMIRLAR